MSAACAERHINHSPGAFTATIATSAATIDTPGSVTLASGLLASAVVGSVGYGCTKTAADSSTTGTTLTSNVIVSASNIAQANLFTAPSYMKVNTLTLLIRMVGGPGGNMYSQLYAAGATDITGAPLATSADVLISNNSGSPLGDLIAFTLPAAVELAAGATYGVTLKPQTGVTLDGSNNFRWLVVNSAPGCTSFPLFRTSSDGGSSWGAGTNPGYQRGYFTVDADQHATSGSASWILTGQASASVWLPSTFTMSENPGGTGGTLTYDVGTGNSSSSATYSSTGLSKAQVQALAEMTGKYFYLRVNFTVPSPGYDRAVVGGGQILYR